MTNLVLQIQKKISVLEAACQRPANSVKLIAVSKGKPISAIEEAFQAGIRDFGENYWQETEKKIISLNSLPIQWHFLGRVQSNKAPGIAKYCHWVHSLDREKIALLLSLHRSELLPPLNICIQVNLDKELNKSGVNPEEVISLARFITELPNITLRGLMAIPHPRLDEKEQYQSLIRLKNLLHKTNEELQLHLDTLSMGMTDDLAAAIKAGSTMVRVGRGLFGERR